MPLNLSLTLEKFYPFASFVGGTSDNNAAFDVLNPNKVYVPGIPDISGSVSGFFNASELALVHAANAATPGYLQLANNSTSDPTILFSGLAYIDADIDCSLKAPKISGAFVAGGAWTLPT